MAHILMINLPFSGHVNPTLPLAEALVNRGHRIDYICSEQFRQKVESTGAEFVPYRQFPDHPTENEKKRLSFQAAFDTALSMPGQYDLLIYEMFFYPGIQAAKQLGIPCVRQFSQPAWSDKTWQDASIIFKASSKLIDVQVMGKKRIRTMNLPFASMDDAIRHSKPDMNIVYVPEALQKYRDTFDSTYYFTIPQQKVTASNIVIPYDKMKYPIAYISLGSIISDKSFYKKCLRALGGKAISVILNTGKVDPKTLGPIPDNIFAYSFVPQIDVLQHADVFLTHCGMNSVNEAICAGVPVVAMPFMNDQLENAAQIDRLKIGKRIHPFPSCAEIEKTVFEVMQDPVYKENVQSMQSEALSSSTWDAAIKAIENLCVHD